MTELQQQIAHELESELKAGSLSPDRLRQGLEEIAGGGTARTQDLLYLQTARSSPSSQVIGMMSLVDGEPTEGALDADEWPYQTVVDAMKDGWRVVSFPNMALLAMNAADAHGLEFEFVLERWS